MLTMNGERPAAGQKHYWTNGPWMLDSDGASEGGKLR